MSKNIEINIATSANTYEVLYPKTTYSNMADVLNIVNTTGILDVSRLSKKPIEVVKGTYIGTLSGYPSASTWQYTLEKKWFCYLLFPGKNTRPDIVIISTTESDLGIFLNLDETKDSCYRNAVAFYGEKTLSSSSTTYTNFGTMSLEFRVSKRVTDYDTGDIFYAENNGIYFAPERTSNLFNTVVDGFARYNTLFLNASGWTYTFYGFYFS